MTNYMIIINFTINFKIFANKYIVFICKNIEHNDFPSICRAFDGIKESFDIG